MTRKSHTRVWQRFFSLGFLFQVLCISTSVHAEPCPSNISTIPTHDYFVRGASLAKLSYKTPGEYRESISYRCPPRNNQARQEYDQSYDVFEQDIILHDIEWHLYSHAKACVEGTKQNRCVKRADRGNGRSITRTALKRRVGGQRFKETHYRCTENDSVLNNLTLTIQWAQARGELSLLLRVGIVGISAIEYTEDLKLVKLESANGEEMWKGVAGTNPFSSKSLLTSIRALQGRSCLFDFALEVAASFFNEKCKRYHNPTNFRGSIVGHSLGGMAAEYIAIEGGINFAMEDCAAKDSSVRVLSYNAIGWGSGVDGNMPENRKYSKIYSIRVNGEILKEHFPGRQYLGHLIRYNAPDDDCKSLCRHGINAVQRAICTCQFCQGAEFSYRGP